jgi:hypothetical protein
MFYVKSLCRSMVYDTPAKPHVIRPELVTVDRASLMQLRATTMFMVQNCVPLFFKHVHHMKISAIAMSYCGIFAQARNCEASRDSRF